MPSWTIQIHEGRDLASKDSNGFSDPFVVMKWVDTRTNKTLAKKKTTTKPKTLTPVWDNETFEFEFEWEVFSHSALEIVMYDKDLIGTDYMGRLEPMEMSSIAFDPMSFAEKQWFTLLQDRKLKHKVSGELCLSYSYKDIEVLKEPKAIPNFIKQGNLQAVKQCVLLGCPVNNHPINGNDSNCTECVLSGTSKALEILKFLVSHGAGLTSPQFSFTPALCLFTHWRRTECSEEFLDYLIEQKAVQQQDILKALRSGALTTVSMSRENRLWKRIAEAKLITNKVWMSLGDNKIMTKNRKLLVEECNLKPPLALFELFVREGAYLDVKIIGKKLGMEVKITPEMIKEANEKTRTVLTQLMEANQQDLELNSDDLFGLTSVKMLHGALGSGSIDVNATKDGKSLFLNYMSLEWPEGCQVLIDTGSLRIDDAEKNLLIESALSRKKSSAKLLQLLGDTSVTVDENILSDERIMTAVVNTGEEAFECVLQNVLGNNEKPKQQELLRTLILACLKKSPFDYTMKKLEKSEPETMREVLQNERQKFLSSSEFYDQISKPLTSFVCKYVIPPVDNLFSSQVDTLAVLEQMRSDPNFDPNQSLKGKPLLYLACQEENEDVIHLLVDCNANPYATSSAGFTSFDALSFQDKSRKYRTCERILKDVESNAEGRTCEIMKHLEEGRLNEAYTMIRDNQPIAGQARYKGHNLLELLVAKIPDSEAELVRIALDNRADPNATAGEKETTPLLDSILKGKLKVTEVLLHRVAYSKEDADKNNLYHMVAVNGSVDLFDLLDDKTSFSMYEQSYNVHKHTPGQLCREILSKGKFSHALLNKKMNPFD